MLSGIKDVDREILKHVDDKELIQVCTIDKTTWYEICDDEFLKRRLMKYPDIEKYKKGDETYKRFFLRFAYYTSKMRETFKFEYTDGDFKEQYELLKKFKGITLLINAAKIGELSLVKYAKKKGADISANGDLAFRAASLYGHLNVVKYLVERGANIHEERNEALRNASYYGYFDIVKYLVENGADVHAANNEALESAQRNRHTKVAQYLRSL